MQVSPGGVTTKVNATRNVAKDDTDLAQFLLPYLVISILAGDDDRAKKELREEILTVLNARVSCEVLSGGVANALVSPSKRGTNDRQIATQRIFGLIDHLSRWLETKSVCFTLFGYNPD